MTNDELLNRIAESTSEIPLGTLRAAKLYLDDMNHEQIEAFREAHAFLFAALDAMLSGIARADLIAGWNEIVPSEFGIYPVDLLEQGAKELGFSND